MSTATGISVATGCLSSSAQGNNNGDNNNSLIVLGGSASNQQSQRGKGDIFEAVASNGNEAGEDELDLASLSLLANKFLTPDEFDRLLLSRLKELEEERHDDEDDLEAEDVEDDEAAIIMDDHDFDLIENITSCNKVENCVMLSEFEQNLLKETEENSTSSVDSAGGRHHKRKRKRKWHGLFPHGHDDSVLPDFGRKSKFKMKNRHNVVDAVIEENSV